MFISYYFSRKTDQCLLLPQRFEKIFSHESKYQKKLSVYIWRRVKYHQHRIRNKTGISLVIILNAFKCPKVSLVSLNCLLWQ